MQQKSLTHTAGIRVLGPRVCQRLTTDGQSDTESFDGYWLAGWLERQKALAYRVRKDGSKYAQVWFQEDVGVWVGLRFHRDGLRSWDVLAWHDRYRGEWVKWDERLPPFPWPSWRSEIFEA